MQSGSTTNRQSTMHQTQKDAKKHLITDKIYDINRDQKYN